MSRQLLFLNTKSVSHSFAVYVPDDWDYWTINGKRVNFNIKKINNPEHPDFVGFNIIIWVFNFYYVWRKWK